LLALVLVSCNGAGTATTTGGDNGSAPATSGDTGAGSIPAGGESELVCWTAAPGEGSEEVTFSDQTEAAGLIDPLLGMYAHAAVWGDVDGDGWQDLFVGTFADRDAADYQVRGATGPAPDTLLINQQGVFAPSGSMGDAFSRTSGGVMADLDGDGDLDLVASRNYDEDMAGAPWTTLLANEGGSLAPVEDSGLPGAGLGGRAVGVLDYDLDGLLDLFIASDEGGSVLLRNEGGLSFTDVTADAGLPVDIFGLGVGIADLTGDRRADIFVAGSNRLFVSSDDGFREADSQVFQWQLFGDEDLITGVSIADVNRDGLLDVAVGHHFNSTVDDGAQVPVRLYLNRGPDGDGMPGFEDVTEAAGLVPFPTKAPHVELNDMDNDGWPDLVATASAGDGTRPAVLIHRGLEGDTPRFGDAPGLGSPQYWVAGPSADFDRDGRLDIFLVEFEPSLPSILLRNETGSGHWLEVSLGAEHGHGIGWLVEVLEPGSDQLIGAREITVTQGYSAGVAPIAHFGLGEHELVDVRLTPPGGNGTITLEGVAGDSHLRYPEGCAGT
jgi:hypothetical protein